MGKRDDDIRLQLEMYDRQHKQSTGRGGGIHRFGGSTPGKLNCTSLATRKILIATNFVFCLCGFSIVVFGLYAMSSSLGDLLGTSLCSGIAVVGVGVMFLAALGWFGARRQSVCMLGCYGGVLTIIMLGILIIAGYVLVKEDHGATLISNMWAHVKNELRVKLQEEYNCCGLRSVTDQPGEPCGATVVTPCIRKLAVGFGSHLQSFGSFGAILGCLMFVDLLFTVYLVLNVRKTQYEAVSGSSLPPLS